MATAQIKRDWLEPPSWWKRWRPLRILALAIIAASLFSTTWTIKKYVIKPVPHPLTGIYTAVSMQKIPLGPFNSYISQSFARTQLSNAGYETSSKSLHTPFSELYPPHDIDTLSVKDYMHLGNEGVLNMEFFNNRLYEVEFIPADADSYASALHAAYPALQRNHIGSSLLVSDDLRISSNVDLVRSDVGQSLHSSPFVIWQDLRLIHQRDQWDRDYGSINPPEP